MSDINHSAISSILGSEIVGKFKAGHGQIGSLGDAQRFVEARRVANSPAAFHPDEQVGIDQGAKVFRELRIRPARGCMSEARAKIVTDFAVWTALSALRSGAPIKARCDVYRLLRAAGFEILFDPSKGAIDRYEFDTWHRSAVEELRRLEPRLNIGWAAKLLNVYLKTRAYIGGDGRPNLSAQLHPPIDRGLWDGLRRRFGRGSDVTKCSHCVTRIKDIETQECYDRIIAGCRLAADALGCKLIEVEQLWTGTDLPTRPNKTATADRPGD